MIDADFDNDPLNHLLEKLREYEIKDAVNDLPKKEREIVLRIFFSNWTQRRIACQLRISEARVSQLKKRGINMLRHILTVIDRNYPKIFFAP